MSFLTQVLKARAKSGQKPGGMGTAMKEAIQNGQNRPGSFSFIGPLIAQSRGKGLLSNSGKPT